ncbi:hypothetical protein JYB64_05290 [Algoriphagus aestuarii]|nr:hypothetical protein [Algoriphagus aestuarii]
MKLIYLTGVIFTLPIFSGFSQDSNKKFLVGKPLYDYSVNNINPFQDQSPFSQLKSLQKQNEGAIPLNREFKIFNPPILEPREMPMAKLESDDRMKMKYFDSDLNYTILIKPLK